MTVRYDWSDIAEWDRKHWLDEWYSYVRREHVREEARYHEQLAKWQSKTWWQRRKQRRPERPRQWASDYYEEPRPEGMRYNKREITPDDLGVFPLYWVEERDMCWGDLWDELRGQPDLPA